MKSKFTLLMKCALLLLLTIISVEVIAQDFTVNGQVVDETGESLPGVTILIKGTTIGTTTDIDGQYALKVSTGDVLIISFVGYQIYQTTIGTQTRLDVQLEPDVLSLEEVVVVAYGTQKKATATGSISTVAPEDILRQPLANVGNSLVGLVPGISGVQYGGEPGNNSTTIRIRGVSTLNSGGQDPLVVIDGVQQDISMLNSMDGNDIASMSVLKDASSTAVYGIRGANGVIIVSTKRGKTGKPKVSLSHNQGITRARELLQPLNSYDYALYRNEAIENDGNQRMDLYFSDTELWKFQNNRDYTDEELRGMDLTAAEFRAAQLAPALYYGSNNYFEQQYGGTSPQSQTNLNISGGTQDVDYYASVGYFQQSGIFDFNDYGGSDNNSHYDRYNFRANVDIKSIKNLTITTDISTYYAKNSGVFGNSSNSGRYFAMNQWLYESAPFKGPGIQDGKLVTGFVAAGDPITQNKGGGGRSPIIEVFNANTGESAVTNVTSLLKLNYKLDALTKGLSVTASGTYNDMQRKGSTRTTSIPTYSATRNPQNPAEILYFGGSVGSDAVNENQGNFKSTRLYVEGRVNYERSFGVHNVSAVTIVNGQKYSNPGLQYNVPEGLLGFASRVTYDFKEKYLAEFNAGFNGSENFPEGSRFGFFPAVSAGWVISNEEFFKSVNFMTWLKIRGSLGLVGNDRSSTRFLYLPSTWGDGSGGPLNGYYFGQTNGSNKSPYYQGAYEDEIGNPSVTWETATKRNLSIETGFFKERLSMTVDVFDEKRKDILWNLGTIPALVGAGLPPANIARVKNKGYEAQLSWREQKNKIGYKISGYIAYAKNTIEYMDEAAFDYPWMNRTGFSLGQYKGYISDGFLNNTNEVNNRPFSSVDGNSFQSGDLRYVDINGDGILDASDRVPIGYSNLPRYSYGGTIAFNIGGFDINLLFTGTLQGSFPIRSENLTTPFFKDNGIAFQWQYDGRWTPEKVEQGITPTFPRAALDNNTNNNGAVASDFWLLSSDHLKLKNIQIGYTMTDLAQKMGIGSIRFSLTANNVWLIKSSFIKGMDPEQLDTDNASRGFVYPMTSTIMGGIKLEF